MGVKTLMLVVGARPNFMKVAPLIREIHRSFMDTFRFTLVHTGQHYDPEMSETFFGDLQIPTPDYNLGVGSASHGVQTARIMERFEPICEAESPSCIVVFGDVNSTLACALVGVKNHVKVAHVEAGLRSFDRSMPEEINRVVTDVLSDFLFATDPEAVQNLKREGIEEERIHRVGDIMVDALFWGREQAKRSAILDHLGLETRAYGVVTLHRAGNVDDRETLSRLIEAIVGVSKVFPLVFPIHPRTESRLKEYGLTEKLFKLDHAHDKVKSIGILPVKPLGYLDFLKLVMDSRFVITDSGGLQKETTLLRVDCLTLRDTTEWPATLQYGTNRLLGRAPSPERLLEAVEGLLAGKQKRGVKLPEFWDGKTSERILGVLKKKLE